SGTDSSGGGRPSYRLPAGRAARGGTGRLASPVLVLLALLARLVLPLVVGVGLLGLLPVRAYRLVQRLGDGPVSFGRRVLVDQRGLRRVVTHPGHQVAGARPGLGGEGVPG